MARLLQCEPGSRKVGHKGLEQGNVVFLWNVEKKQRLCP